MSIWQQVVVGLGAVVSVAIMVAAIIRLFTRRASGSGVVREATAAESGLSGAEIPKGTRIFDGWSYRVGARFAGRVRVAVSANSVALAGPRVPRRLYEAWIWVQGMMLALVPPSALAAAVFLDARWLAVAVVLLVVSFCISMGGAGLWPGLGELFVTDDGRFFALEFDRDSVSEVDVGKGWSKGGLGVVLWPYKAGVDAMAQGKGVSFFAPDEFGREVRFAIHLFTAEDVRDFKELLGVLERIRA